MWQFAAEGAEANRSQARSGQKSSEAQGVIQRSPSIKKPAMLPVFLCCIKLVPN
jgi:hypothetical protein